MKKTAIIISVYRNDNPQEFVEMMSSLQRQNMQGFDIFIQEDGVLPGGYADLLAGYHSQNQIKYLGHRDTNHGLAFSLNELINIVMESGYHYIVRMDADDICMPERISKQYQFMEANPNIDVVGGWIEEFAADQLLTRIVTYPEQHEKIKAYFARQSPMAHVTAFFRRSFFEKVIGYRTNTYLNEDQGLWIDGFVNGCIFGNIPEVLVRVRIGEGMMTRRTGLKKAVSIFKLKIGATHRLKLGLMGYVNAIALALVFLVSPGIKKLLYKYLR